jgi:hypothetical protein
MSKETEPKKNIFAAIAEAITKITIETRTKIDTRSSGRNTPIRRNYDKWL